jgi:hypothetical protein
MSGQLHAPVSLSRRNSPRYPWDKRLGEPQGRSGQHGEVIILDPTGTRIPTPRSSSQLPVDSHDGYYENIKVFWDVTPCSLKMGSLPMFRRHLVPLFRKPSLRGRLQVPTHPSLLYTGSITPSKEPTAPNSIGGGVRPSRSEQGGTGQKECSLNHIYTHSIPKVQRT